MTDSIYVVRLFPSRKLLMLMDEEGLEIVLKLQKEDIARLKHEDPCMFHNTYHGTVEVAYWGKAWQIFGETWDELG